MEISIAVLVAIFIYYIMVYLTTKLYVKKTKKEPNIKMKSTIVFLLISTIYIVFTFVSAKIYNYASVEVMTDANLSWITIGWPSIQFNNLSVIISTIFQILQSIVYAYLVTLFVKGNVSSKFKMNTYMIVFYICTLASILILSFGYYGFLQGNLYHYQILKVITDITIFITIVLYPVFMCKDIVLEKFKK
jgi:hypothetical protein